MPVPNTVTFQYECGSCSDRFDVAMTFDEKQAFDRDEAGNWTPAGYPEEHPECPQCHSHDVVRVNVQRSNPTK